jgi:fructose-bisphosphate aldolase class II
MSFDQVRLWRRLMGVREVAARNFEELGLVNTRGILKKALKNRYAVPGYNFYNLEQVQGILYGCAESNSPVILQILRGNLNYTNLACLMSMVKGAIQSIREKGSNIPVALNLDHGDNLEICRICVDWGFSSVMIDGSFLPYEENVRLTRSVVEYAHEYDVSVEGELGGIAGIEERVTPEEKFTKPNEVDDFISRTEVDSLAISIGTAHGAYKFKLEEGSPRLRFDILDEIRERVGSFPLVLHGASSVPSNYVDMINTYGGNMVSTVGVREDQLQEAIRRGICKINFDTDIKLIFTAITRKFLAEHPGEYDPKKYLEIARNELKDYIKRKNEILFSAGRA